MPSNIRLRYLYESARLGTMNAASESLDVATSSVSRQIAQLEEELGLPLIEKGRRRIGLTEAGEAVCKYYREKLSQEEAFLSHIKEMKKVRTGKIVLAVGEAFITQGFSDMLDDFMQQYSGLEIRVLTSNTIDVSAQIRDDVAHLGLIFDIPREPGISARLIIPQPLKVIVHKDHHLRSKEDIDLRSIQKESIGLPDSGYRIRQIIHEAEQEEGTFLEPSLITNSLVLLKDFVLSGRGISILPELVVHERLNDGSLVALASNNTMLNSTQTSLITRVGRQLPVGAYRLMNCMQIYLKSMSKLHG
ncbi:MAG: LysR family transcriptional regulator [Arenicella sp.]|jgi:DNA-binding transcriptional LysR family regulator|nr:LysR family transcriptional regulator [Arenicella sp.]